MVTYAQLQAESYWGREIQPAPLVQLGNRLCAAFDRPRTAFGIKGDNRHLNGSHRSQEWILKSRYCTNRTYTVQSGLTAHQARLLAGFDFNPGSEARMVAICKRLDVAVRAGRLEQVLAWYGNDDGDNIVDGYDNIRNRIASSDASHLWHLHLTCDRKLVENEAAIREIGDVLLNEQEEEDEVSYEEVWETDKMAAPAGYTEGDTWRASSVLRSAHLYARTAAERGAQILAGQAAITAAIAGQDVAQAAADAAGKAAREGVRAEMVAAQAAFATVIREELGDATDEQLERVFRRVFGSLDQVPADTPPVT